MRIREGFISIIALIVMSVLMIMALYLGYTTKLEYLILSSTNNNTQSYYQAEGKIYMSLYDDKYYKDQLYPILLKYFRTYPLSPKPGDIIMASEDLESGDEMKNITVSLIDKDYRKELKLVAKSNYKNVTSIVTSAISLFNDLVEIGQPLLAPNLITSQYEKKFDELINKIYKDINIKDCNKLSNIYAMESSNYDEIVLYKKDTTNFEIACSRDGMSNAYVEGFNKKEIFIILRKFGDLPVNFRIEDPNNSKEKIEVSGVLYVEGNIIITSNFKFNGIMIVKNGEIIVEADNKPNIRGIVIFEDTLEDDILINNMDIVYDRSYIYKYGTFIPGFLEPKIDLIKSN